MTIKNGDLPAMPITVTESILRFANNVGDEAKSTFGLTKREHFAALAMQAIITSKVEQSDFQMARLSCIYADALLAELERTK